MENIKKVAGAVSCVILLGGWSLFGGSNYTVEVDGTKGIAFSGSCMTATASTSSNRDAAGTVPLSFQIKGMLISCSVQKRGEHGELRLTIKEENGKVAATSATSQPYGVAMAATQ